MSETYHATVEAVIDGDTCDVLVDLGLNVYKRERLRFAGIDAPETRSRDPDEKRLGLDAKAYVERAAAPGARIRLRVSRAKSPYDKFGRLLAHVYDDVSDVACERASLNERMLADGYAFAYDGTSARGAHDLDRLRAIRRAAGTFQE